MNTLGSNLRKIRIKHDISLREMAESFGASYGTIAKYERGERMPDPDTLSKLAIFYNVSVDYLLGRTEDPRPFPTEDTRPIEEKADERLIGLYGKVKDFDTQEYDELLNQIEFLLYKHEQKKKEK